MKFKNTKLASQTEIPLPKVNLNGTIYVPEATQEKKVRRGPGRPPKSAASLSQPTQQNQQKKKQVNENDQMMSMKNLIDQPMSIIFICRHYTICRHHSCKFELMIIGPVKPVDVGHLD